MNKNINIAVPRLANIWGIVKKECSNKGLDVRLSCVARSQEEQCALYLRGRYPLDAIAVLYFTIFRQTLTNKTNVIVTRTIYSKHVITENGQLSHALDFYICKGGEAIWDVKADVNDDNKGDYVQVAEMFEKLGCRSGRSWGDICHVEIV